MVLFTFWCFFVQASDELLKQEKFIIFLNDSISMFGN